MEQQQTSPEEKKKKTSTGRKIRKIILRTLLALILLLLGLAIALSLPSVQTYIAEYATDRINSDFKTDIKVEQVAITFFGGVKLKKVMIRDHHKDTLIYANRIKTNILDLNQMINGDLLFGTIRLDGLVFNLKQYKNEGDTNLDRFVALFDSDEPSSGKKFLMKAQKAYFTNSRFIMRDMNRPNPVDVDFRKINSEIAHFKIYGPDVTMDIQKMALLDHRGLYVKNLASQFTYTKKNIKLENLDLLTDESYFKGKAILRYNRKDFADFNNKVQFDIRVDDAVLATNDIRHFYKELGKNNTFKLRSHVTGTLNDLTATKLRLVDARGSQIVGNVNFKNLFGKEEQQQYFYMNGNFSRVSSNYKDLTALLPNVLGKKLPSSLSKLGDFNLTGTAEITAKTIDTDFFLRTVLGNIKSNLTMTDIDNIDNATYVGTVIMDDFDLGNFLDRKDIGKVSLNVDVDGKGFTEQYLDTKFSGDIHKIHYNNYTYSRIVVDGSFKKPFFKGEVYVNDPNLFMDFEGQVNFSKKEYAYDFHTKVDYANLSKLKFVKDSVSIFKGDVVMKISGNSLDNLQGNVYINQTSYQNSKDTYYFDDFVVSSTFDADRIRTITVNSPDIIDGKIVGKFEFGQLRKMVENSLGSLYANYSPNKVKKGQFLKFNFTVYNKIFSIFYPGISIAENTNFKGSINSDDDDFKLNFRSPKVTAFDNSFDNIRVDIDNKNPLFNAYIALDSIKTKQYKIQDFSLINVTTKDTLFLRSEFKGGNQAQDYYNLNLYHTINKEKQSIVGIQKSELKFRDYLWHINENDTDDNKVVFDKALKNFTIDNIVMSHEQQKIEFDGTINGKTNKDLMLRFTDVELDKLLPSLDRFAIAGNMNGVVNFRENNAIYQPTSKIKIENLKLNAVDLGTMNLTIAGDESLSKFVVNSNIENKNVESFTAQGTVEVTDKKTNLDLDLNFDDFNLGVLSSLGRGVLSNIRGFASGRANIGGSAEDLEINGRLFLKEAGMGVPYLNTDYEIERGAIVDVTEKRFLIRNVTIKDTEFGTEGRLYGHIEHNNFGDWKLDLTIDSNRLLALNTKDSEDAAYFGTAFINGSASIKGPTDALFIKVDAKSEKGTHIKIPINDAEGTGDSNYIHFISATEKYNLKKGIVEKRDYNGLELEFDFDITPDADIEVILDRNSGHGMKGKGFGSLLFKINTLGKFNMWGDFQAYEGTYNFRYGGLINKKFDVKKGGSITWEGDPMRAVLNLEAVYTTQANPALLLENASFNKKVPVEVVIGLKGNLSNPEPNFDINFPTVSSVLKSEIQTKLDDKDVRQKQALILLSTGSFLSEEGVNQSSIANNLYEKASDIFGNVFKDEGDKINFGLDLVGVDRTPGRESDGRVGVTVSTKVSERITINGKLGVPVGGINESAVVGNVEVQYRVNEDGTMNLRVFNRENDINYIGEGIGYTQGIGINYEVDFNTFAQLVNKIFKSQKIGVEKTPVLVVPDSEAPNYIDFEKETKKEKEEQKEELKKDAEAIPTED
ncbi:translocation/assembly module TamB domain-containing protein [Flavobacterium sp.]|uniref:translocation/assembly module TamB domain-containing protein n=1 Tax=Flavobacterium sp. TaxID=239 RepID=UPI0039E5BDDA